MLPENGQTWEAETEVTINQNSKMEFIFLENLNAQT